MGKQEPLGRIERKLDTLTANFEKANFKEYIDYVHDRKRMLRNAFTMGLVRGLGAAIGFSLLGALMLMLLQAVARSSIPLLGDFIAEIIKIVDSKRIPPGI